VIDLPAGQAGFGAYTRRMRRRVALALWAVVVAAILVLGLASIVAGLDEPPLNVRKVAGDGYQPERS
jgi:hypothetical protein